MSRGGNHGACGGSSERFSSGAAGPVLHGRDGGAAPSDHLGLSTSGPSSTSHSRTATSPRLLISSTSSPSAVAFSITISSNRAQTSTGGPSQTSRPNQPESV